MNKNLKKVISSTVALSLSASAFLAFAGAASAAYPDVASDNAYAAAINNLTALGIVSGDDTGNFNPDATLKRSEAAKMIVEAFTSNGSVAQTATEFTDVPASHWASGYIAAGVASGYINGYGDGTFGPDDTLTYAQVIKLIVGSMNYSSDAEYAGGYPSGYMQIAYQNEINKGVDGVSADTQVTRAQVAQLIDNALDSPLKEYVGNDTNVWGQIVPKYEKKDGTGEFYSSPLIYYHDAYVVEGRVIATNRTDSSLNEDEVKFNIEYSRNFDDLYFKKNTNYNDADQKVRMVVGDTNAADYLLTYAEAYVAENEDGDWEIIAFNPSGKNVEQTFAADAIETDNKNYTKNTVGESILDQGKIYLESPKQTYNLNQDDNKNTDVGVYVNGVEVNKEEAAKYLTLCLSDNAVGEVTLIDTPSSTGSSADGKYDYIMITFGLSGIVSATQQTSTQSKLILNKYQLKLGELKVGLTATINLPEDDDNFVYTVKSTDGTEMSIADIQEDDVVTVYFNVVEHPDTPSDSNFVDIVVSRDTVEGQVMTSRRDGDTVYYTIDGEEYAAAIGLGRTLNIGDSYLLRLDASGRFVDSDEAQSSKLYAIVDRVNINTNDEKQVKLITASGNIQTYIVSKGTVYNDALGICYTEGSTKSSMLDRVVTYKVNKNNEITQIQKASDASMKSDIEYTERTNKLGGWKLADDASVVDISEAYSESSNPDQKAYTSSDVSSSDPSLFEEDTPYTAIVANKASSGSTYRFVVVLAGTSGIGMDAPLAVVDSYGQGQFEEETAYFVRVAGKGMAELTDLYVSDDVNYSDVTSLKKGDVITYSLNGSGAIKNLQLVFKDIDGNNKDVKSDLYKKYAIEKSANPSVGSAEDWYQTFFAKEDADGKKEIGVPSRWSSSLTSSDNYVRVAFGPIVDKIDDSVTLAKVLKDGNTYYTPDDETFLIDFADDVNIFVCDFSEGSKKRIQPGISGSVLSSNIPDAAKDSSDTIYWTSSDSSQESVESLDMDIYYAFVKMVDQEITDLYLIAPSN